MKQIFNIVSILFIIFIDGSLSAKISGSKQVKSQEDTSAWFNKYGYNPCLDSGTQCSLSLNSTVSTYQQRFHLRATGKLDDSTKRHMNRPRCGNKDKQIAELNSPASLTQKWSRSSLTYSIRSYPTQLTETNTKNIIREAFKAWVDYIPLEIRETCSTCSSDFIIEFARDQHSDSYPFDGMGGILAHAFLPEDGRVHFDKDEAWTERFNDDQTNLFLVAVHVIGHALGLDHTYNEKSIMYPSYQPMAKSNILPQTDRDAIQKLYGRKQSSSLAPTTTRLITTTTASRRSVVTTRSSITVPGGRFHPLCRLFVDAAFDHPEGTLHAFRSGLVWRYLSNEHKWDDRAPSINQMYSALPDRPIAAVYNKRTKQLVFFTNENVYQYDIDSGNNAKYHNEERLPRNLRNSIIGAIYYRSEIYIITGKTMRLFQLDNGYEQSDERNLKDAFPRFTGTVKKAFTYVNLHHFFTTDGLVYVWSERLNSWQTSGKPMETGWFACLGTDTYVTRESQATQTYRYRSRHRHHNHYPNDYY